MTFVIEYEMGMFCYTDHLSNLSNKFSYPYCLYKVNKIFTYKQFVYIRFDCNKMLKTLEHMEIRFICRSVESVPLRDRSLRWEHSNPIVDLV